MNGLLLPARLIFMHRILIMRKGQVSGYAMGFGIKQFNVIANVNDLLAFVDVDPLVFASALDHDLIKGEALALRAFLHFDLLRLYVPYDINGSADGESDALCGCIE